MASSFLICQRNRIDSATLSGGSWQTALANVQDQRLSKVARSSDLELSSTRIAVDLGTERTINTAFLSGHNCDLDALVRVTGYADAALSEVEYDSGWLSVYPPIFDTSSLEWEAENWWSGQILSEDIDGYPRQFALTFPDQWLRYWLFEFNNQANAAGYLNIGRLLLGQGTVLSGKVTRTPTLGVETDTSITRSISGAPYARRRPSRRVAQFRIEAMDQLGAAQAIHMAYERGVDRDVLVSYATDDPLLFQDWTILGRMRALSPAEYTETDFAAMNYEIEEING